MLNEEGGVDPEQFRMEAMFDRMDAIGKSVLGLTIQCAQCHNHKYDPLTQEEYYRLFAFLNNDYEANVAVYTPDEQRQRADLFRHIHEIEAGLRHRHPDWPERMAGWEETVRNDQPVWTVVRPAAEDLVPGGQKHYLLADGSILAQGYAPTKDVSEIRVKTTVPNITGFRLELLNDPNLPLDGPGRSITGTCALTEFSVTAAPLNAPSKAVPVEIVSATADVNPPETPLAAIFDDKTGRRRVTGPISFAIDHNDKTAWGIDIGPHRRNQPRKAVFVAAKPVSFPNGTVLTFALSQRHGGWNSDDNQNNNLGRYRLSVTNAPHPKADPLPQNVREILAIPREKRSPAQIAAVFSYWRTTVPEWKEANDAIEALWRQHPEGSSQFVLEAREMPRATHVLKRGDFLKPERTVSPGVPSFLQPLPANAPPTRLTFARWLTDRRSPTTARSIVNRVWQSYFGIGIVSTSEDLGSQSETPSHPKLLGLAGGGVHGSRLESQVAQPSDRDVGHLSPIVGGHARQVRSRSVQPASGAGTAVPRRRRNRPRYCAREQRPVVFAAGRAERLSPAPDFLFLPPASYGPKIWKEEIGPNRYRRALYTFRYRSVPYPALQTFDAPNGDFSCVRRSRSNTPLQALTSLNEPLFLECARALALKTVWRGGSDDRARLIYAFRRCLSRQPSPEELSTLLALYDKEKAHFASDTSSALAFVVKTMKDRPSLPTGTTVDELAGWTAVSRVLLNLDETITKE